MRKIINIFMVQLLILAILITGQLGVFAFDDVNLDFDGVLDGWVRKSSTGSISTETVDGKTCLTIKSEPKVQSIYTKNLDETLTATDGLYVMSYDVMIPDINTDSTAGKQTVILEGVASNTVVSMYGLRIDNGVVSYYNGTGNQNISTAYKYGDKTTLKEKLSITENEWHNLKSVYNVADKNFTYYVDDVPLFAEDGSILKVTPYTKVTDTLDATKLNVTVRNISDTDKIYIDNISIYKTDIDYDEVYTHFHNGLDDWALRSGSGTITTEQSDAEHTNSMVLHTSGKTLYYEKVLDTPIEADNRTYTMSYDLYIDSIPADGSKQSIYLVGQDYRNKTYINAFYGLRIDNAVVSYFNGNGAYDTSTASLNGEKYTLSIGEWHNIKTVYDRASATFTYYIDNQPLLTQKGDIIRIPVERKRISEKITRMVIALRDYGETVYFDNIHLRETEKEVEDEYVNVYNVRFKDSSGAEVSSDNISGVTNLTVDFDYDSTNNFTALIPLYKEDVLVGLEMEKIDVSDNGYITGASFDVSNPKAADTAKVFVWDNMKNIKPYIVYNKSDCVEITEKINKLGIDTENFTVTGDELKVTYKNSVDKIQANTLRLKAPVMSSDESKNVEMKYDSTTGSPETAYYLNVTVNNKNYHNRKDGVVYELDVKYFDEGYGCFTVEYDTIYESLKEAEYVELNNTCTWKTHTFVLEDPYFTGVGTDFRLCTWAENMRYSNFDVFFTRITLRSNYVRDQFEIKSTGNQVGNIYYTGETATFTTTVSNRDFYEYSNTFGTYDATIKYTLVDENKNFVKNIAEKSITINPISTVSDSVSFTMDKYGLYYLKVEVIDEDKQLHGEKYTEVSYVNSDKTTVNPDYGTSIQVNIYDDNDGAEYLAKNAGIGMLRWIRPMRDIMSLTYSNSGYSITEKGWNSDWTKYETLLSDKYTFLNNLLASGIIYSDDVDPVYGYKLRVPYGDTGREIFAQYCAYFAENYKKLYPDDVRYYEIWNEFDSGAGTSFNTNGENWTNYGDILVAAADAIYAVDPDAEIVALSSRYVNTHTRAINRVKEIIAAGDAEHELQDYFKHASIHPYHWNDNPMNFSSTEFTEDINTMAEHMEKLRNAYDNAGLTETKLWITEIAWSPHYTSIYDQKAITEKQQGSYLVQSYVMSKKNNMTDKYLPYLFARQTDKRVDRDKNMGILKPYSASVTEVPLAATSAYLAVSNLNMLMTGATYVDDFFFDDTTGTAAAYRFERANGEDIAILWSILEDGETVSINLGCTSITVYDEYGNSSTLTSDTGIYEFDLTQSTVYATGTFTAFDKE